MIPYSEAHANDAFPVDFPENHPAALKHYPTASEQTLQTTLGNDWRHGFDILLTQEQNRYTLFEADGDRHEFKRQFHDREVTDETYSAMTENAGQLARHGGRHYWSRADGFIVEFVGSLPTIITRPGQFSQQLNYHNGRLQSVDLHAVNGPSGRQFDFSYDSGRLTHVRFENQRWYEYAFDSAGQLALAPALTLPTMTVQNEGLLLPRFRENTTECVAEHQESQTCNTEASRPPVSFSNPSEIPGATRLDVRPASCRSYFTDYYGTFRGEQIENGLKDNEHYRSLNDTVRSFPIIDFFDNGEVRVVRSRDLTSATLSSENGKPLFNRLMRDGREIQQKLLEPLARDGKLTVEENGESTSINNTDVEVIVLEVIVRYDTATAAQISQIEEARAALLEQYNVVLNIIEIP